MKDLSTSLGHVKKRNPFIHHLETGTYFNRGIKQEVGAMPTWVSQSTPTLTEMQEFCSTSFQRSRRNSSIEDLKTAFQGTLSSANKTASKIGVKTSHQRKETENRQKTLQDRMTTSFLQGEVAALSHGQRKTPSSWKPSEGGNKPNFKKGFKNKQRPDRKSDRFSLLTKTPKEIFALGKRKFKPSPPCNPVEKRIRTNPVNYHSDNVNNDGGASSEVLYNICFIKLPSRDKGQWFPPLLLHRLAIKRETLATGQMLLLVKIGDEKHTPPPMDELHASYNHHPNTINSEQRPGISENPRRYNPSTSQHQQINTEMYTPRSAPSEMQEGNVLSEKQEKAQRPKARNRHKLARILTKQVLVEELKEKSINEKDILDVVEEEGNTWMTPICEYLTKEILPEDTKMARAIWPTRGDHIRHESSSVTIHSKIGVRNCASANASLP
ncbi:hypothetical protein Tco_0545217 [Tanacetum coccineum]